VAVERALPFDVKVPNVTTMKAVRAAYKGKGKTSDLRKGAVRGLGI
jgi:antitoxin component of RelBE/YafQ-DinJ toxin-antitoxin module